MSIRQWQGQRSDIPVVSGEHLLTAKNITFGVAGQISRRSGLTFLDEHGGRSVSVFGASSGTYLITVDSTGSVEATSI